MATHKRPDLQIIAKPHPLRPDTYSYQASSGSTLAELLPDAAKNVYAHVNGELWDRERWHEPLPEGMVNLFTSPHGNDGWRMVAMIAVAAAAAWTGGAAASAMGMVTEAGALTFGGSLVAGGIAGATTLTGPLSANQEGRP